MEIWEFLLMMFMSFLAGGLLISLAYDRVQRYASGINLDTHYLQTPRDSVAGTGDIITDDSW